MKILIVRTSAMGDIVHSLPVLIALRRALPSARFAWVVEETFAPLLDGHPDLDELIVVRLRSWRKHPFSATVRREVRELWQSLRRFQPDVALDLMGNFKGAVLARLSGAPRRIGAARSDRREPASAFLINDKVTVSGEHAVDQALSLLAPLLGEVPSADFGGDKLFTQVPPATAAFLARQEKPFVLIQAGAGWANKRYPTASWGAVARKLHERTGWNVWLPLAPGEEELATAIVAASDGVARTVEAYDLAALAALLRHARLLLGGDTGPLHLAHALGTPVLCLMGPTDPRRNGPYQALDRVLWRQLPCSFCHKRYNAPQTCLVDLSPDEVVEKTSWLLQASRHSDRKGSV